MKITESGVLSLSKRFYKFWYFKEQALFVSNNEKEAFKEIFMTLRKQ